MEGGPVSSFFNTMDDSSDEKIMIAYYYYHTKKIKNDEDFGFIYTLKEIFTIDYLLPREN
jgi:hypothetical protein